jgi:hypothetical protein
MSEEKDGFMVDAFDVNVGQFARAVVDDPVGTLGQVASNIVQEGQGGEPEPDARAFIVSRAPSPPAESAQPAGRPAATPPAQEGNESEGLLGQFQAAVDDPGAALGQVASSVFQEVQGGQTEPETRGEAGGVTAPAMARGATPSAAPSASPADDSVGLFGELTGDADKALGAAKKMGAMATDAEAALTQELQSAQNAAFDALGLSSETQDGIRAAEQAAADFETGRRKGNSEAVAGAVNLLPTVQAVRAAKRIAEADDAEAEAEKILLEKSESAAALGEVLSNPVGSGAKLGASTGTRLVDGTRRAQREGRLAEHLGELAGQAQFVGQGVAIGVGVGGLAAGGAVAAEGGAVAAEGGAVAAEGGAVAAEGGAVAAEGGAAAGEGALAAAEEGAAAGVEAGGAESAAAGGEAGAAETGAAPRTLRGLGDPPTVRDPATLRGLGDPPTVRDPATLRGLGDPPTVRDPATLRGLGDPPTVRDPATLRGLGDPIPPTEPGAPPSLRSPVDPFRPTELPPGNPAAPDFKPGEFNPFEDPQKVRIPRPPRVPTFEPDLAPPDAPPPDTVPNSQPPEFAPEEAAPDTTPNSQAPQTEVDPARGQLEPRGPKANVAETPAQAQQNLSDAIAEQKAAEQASSDATQKVVRFRANKPFDPDVAKELEDQAQRASSANARAISKLRAAESAAKAAAQRAKGKGGFPAPRR